MYRVLVVMLVAVALYKAYVRFRAHHISLRKFIAWFGVWMGVLVFGMIPQLSDRITNVMGVGRGADLFFFFSIVVLVYVIFGLYSRMERMQQEMTELVRQLALRDAEKKADAQANAESERPAD